MSKKRNQPNHRKRHKVSRTAAGLSRQIFVAAQKGCRLKKKGNFDEESSFRLYTLIEKALESGSDKHVLLALKDLDEVGDVDAVDLVIDEAEEAATSRMVWLESDDGTGHGGEIRLFLVPVMLVTEAGQTIPRSIQNQVEAGKGYGDQYDRYYYPKPATTWINRCGTLGHWRALVVCLQGSSRSLV